MQYNKYKHFLHLPFLEKMAISDCQYNYISTFFGFDNTQTMKQKKL